MWDFRRTGELTVSTGSAYQDQPLRTVFAGPGDGEYAAFQPGAANAMSYDDLKVIEAHNSLRAVTAGVTRGDHFAEPGANDRVWGALGKLALRAPGAFAYYYANGMLALAARA